MLRRRKAQLNDQKKCHLQSSASVSSPDSFMKGGGGKNIITYKLTEWINIFRGSENNYTPCGSEDEEMARIRTWIKCHVSDLHFSHKPGHFQNSASHFSSLEVWASLLPGHVHLDSYLGLVLGKDYSFSWVWQRCCGHKEKIPFHCRSAY